jgi:uncharacterized protein YsxB (DUF464 family)
MIKVKFTESYDKLSLQLEGHAGYAEHGKDIVCASASILAYTVAQYVKLANENGEFKTPPDIVLNGGDAFVCCEHTEEAKKMFDFAELGYQLLKYNYPQYVRLNES